MARPTKFTLEQLENITKNIIKNRKKTTPLSYAELSRTATQILGLTKPLDLRVFSRCSAVVDLVTTYNSNLTDISKQIESSDLVIEEHLISIDKAILSCHNEEDIKALLQTANNQIHEYATKYEEMFSKLGRLQKELDRQKTSNTMLTEDNNRLRSELDKAKEKLAKSILVAKQYAQYRSCMHEYIFKPAVLARFVDFAIAKDWSSAMESLHTVYRTLYSYLSKDPENLSARIKTVDDILLKISQGQTLDDTITEDDSDEPITIHPDSVDILSPKAKQSLDLLNSI